MMSKKLNRTAALAISEKRYRTLVETMGDGLSEIDENQVTTYANDMLCKMWGRTQSEIIGKKVIAFLDQKNRNILKEQLRKRRKGGRTPYEIVWTKKDGTKLPTIMTPTPYFDSDGNFKGSFAIITDISKHKKEQKVLEQAHYKLEERVAQRTQELEEKTIRLEEANTALRVLLKKREEDKTILEERMLLNIRELVLPYIEKLQDYDYTSRQKTCLDIVESTLNDIVSPFLHRISLKYLKLTPSEIQVANLVKYGNSTKEIADILNLSNQTIEFYRKNIGKKMGITNKSVNLRTYLISIK
ncbi:MAG: PAS domain S-box protein [Desulfobacula sp.]|nr:PAS domain S-box protein [Desulfobacula sp.]